MKRILIAIAIIISIQSLTLAQTASQSKSCEQTARGLELRMGEIFQTFDKTGYEQLVSDDVVMVDNNGEISSKKQEIASLNRPPELTSISLTTKDVKIRVCGEMNIVITGKDIITIKEKGEKESEDRSFWFTRIYEKRQAQWQLVYSQVTAIKE